MELAPSALFPSFPHLQEACVEWLTQQGMESLQMSRVLPVQQLSHGDSSAKQLGTDLQKRMLRVGSPLPGVATAGSKPTSSCSESMGFQLVHTSFKGRASA